VRILGLVFAGTATDRRHEMTVHSRAPDGELYELVETR
jgi:hypothetical protein